MRQRLSSIGLCLAGTVCFFAYGAPARPQPAPPVANAPRPVDPKVTAAQTAFEALPEASRVAVQNDLVWVTNFSGAALGTFGRLTFEAISAFQKSVNQPVDGILTDKQRSQLADAAVKARAAMRFSILTDPVTGSGIGIPAALLTKPEKTAIGSKWSSDNGSVVLETVRTAPDKADMPATFDRFVNATVPGRKVTYKLLRPDFFVVTGETPPKKFYTRFAPTPEGLRGYTLTYDAALSPGIDKIVIAIANTFEPLKAAHAAPATAPPPAAAPVALSPVQAAPTERSFTALNLGGGKLVTAAKAIEGCKSVTVAGKPVQIVATDAATGIALLGGESTAGSPTLAALRDSAIVSNEQLVAFGVDAASHKVTVSPGASVIMGKEAQPGLAVALQNGSAGSLVLDRQGQVAGLVADLPPLNIQIAGTLPVRPYRLATSQAMKTFLEQKGVKLQLNASTGEKTTGELAQIAGKLVTQLICAL